ncbi:hypothetical protein BZA05DRAFT_436224, partial [Tricharina praecox]|uniref:uncharacterized protein n=1 Tax=Tricharina praecox TaxID=43433 RepID=UPI00221F8B0C
GGRWFCCRRHSGLRSCLPDRHDHDFLIGHSPRRQSRASVGASGILRSAQCSRPTGFSDELSGRKNRTSEVLAVAPCYVSVQARYIPHHAPSPSDAPAPSDGFALGGGRNSRVLTYLVCGPPWRGRQSIVDRRRPRVQDHGRGVRRGSAAVVAFPSVFTDPSARCPDASDPPCVACHF